MKTSLLIARVSKIDIKIHWTFLLLIGWFIIIGIRNNQDVSSILFTILFVLLLFVCVVLHELGHALTAQKFNIPTKDITLLPIGGVAKLERIPENPKEEFLVAIAGPAVNVVISGILFLLITLIKPLNFSYDFSGTFSPNIMMANLMVANVVLVLFNLIPAFPMDGGRIFRSLLSMKIDRIKATRIAARAGQFFAILFVLLGLFSNPFLIFIGIFVYLGAMAEGNMVETKGLLKGHKVHEVMRTNFTLVNANDNLQSAINQLLAGSEEDFLVVDDHNIVTGVLSRNSMIKAIRENQQNEPINQFMDKDVNPLTDEDDISELSMNAMKPSFNIMPVYRNGELVGVLDKDNLSEFIMIMGAQHS